MWGRLKGGYSNQKGELILEVGPNTRCPKMLVTCRDHLRAMFKTFQDFMHKLYDVDLINVSISYGGLASSVTMECHGKPFTHVLTAYEDSYLCMILDHLLFYGDCKMVFTVWFYLPEGDVLLHILDDKEYALEMQNAQILCYDITTRRISHDFMLFSDGNKKYIKGNSVDEAFSMEYMARVQKDNSNLLNKYIALDGDIDINLFHLSSSMAELVLDEK
jgi:hypothetical protein